MFEGRERVQVAIDQLVESGAERGIQVAVYRNGELLVDAVAGVADPVSGRPVTQDTPFYNFSIVKGATATIAHLLAERGLFAYDTPVAELWPEFAAHGKQGVTIRHVLTQSAGVPGVPLETDAHYQRAKAAGVAVLNEPHTTLNGTRRGYCARDLEGNLWSFGTAQPRRQRAPRRRGSARDRRVDLTTRLAPNLIAQAPAPGAGWP